MGGKAENSPQRLCSTALVRSTILLDSRLASTARLHEILRHHDRMQFNARIEREEPRLDNRRYLGGVLHVEDQQGRPFPLIIDEIHGLGLHIREDGLNGGPERSRLYRPVPGLDRNVHFDKKS